MSARRRQSTLSIVLAIGTGLLFWGGAFSKPSSLPARAVIDWPQIAFIPIASGLSNPVHVTHAGDGSGRLFVVEQAGRIKIIKNGLLQSTPFLNITGRVRDTANEEGLLSVAFPPNYASKQHFYVYYTNEAGNNVLARYGLSNPNRANPDSEQIILTFNHPNHSNHNGGQLAFGPNDSYLYISTGDGGGSGDPNNNAQNPNSLLGKILRIDVETGNPTTYTIPKTNPFTQTTGFKKEIWAMGLRNPWRFSFDRQSKDIYIGDVGQNKFEEINFQPAASPGGQNYGWRILEGNHCFNPSSGCVPPANYSAPIAEYDHSLGCSVTGGMVYRGPGSARMQGVYFFADFCSGRIWGLKRDGAIWQSSLLLDSSHNISSFGEDEAGNLYLAHRSASNGAIYRIVDIASIPPTGFIYLPTIFHLAP